MHSDSDRVTCLLCEHECDDLHPLVFGSLDLSAFKSRYPNVELSAELSRYGVCDECCRRYHGQQRRIMIDMDKLLEWLGEPPRVLN